MNDSSIFKQIFIGVVVGLIVGVILPIITNNDDSPALACSTPNYSCPLAVLMPKNVPCFCATPYGPIPGISR